MSEPIWNPAFEPGHDAPEDLTNIHGQGLNPTPASHPSPIVIPGQGQDESLPARASSVVSSLFVSHPTITVPSGPLLFPQGHPGKLEPDEPDEEPQPEPSREEREEEKAVNKIDDDDDGAEEAAPGKASAAALVSRLLPLAQAAGSAGVRGWQLAWRFPRAALGSALSVAILASVMILQPGKGEHDTTAQIPGATGSEHARNKPVEKEKVTETTPPAAESPSTSPPATTVAKINPPAPARSAASAPDDSKGKLESPVAKPAPAPPGNARGEKGLAAADHQVLAPAPPISSSEMPPLPDVEQVKLAAVEKLAPLPSIEGPPLKAPDHNEAAPAPPLMELAAADLKPGTPPSSVPLPAPAPAPSPPLVPAATPGLALAPAPAPTGTPAPAPTGTPAPAPTGTPAPAPTGTPAPAPAGTLAPAKPPAQTHDVPSPGAKSGQGANVPAPAPTKEVKPEPANPAKPASPSGPGGKDKGAPVKEPVPIPAPAPASHGGAAVAGAAVAAGTAGLAVGTGIGAAVTALTKGSGDKHKDEAKVQAKPEPPKPAPAPAPIVAAPVSTPVKPAETKPQAVASASHAEPSKTSPIPAPHESTQAKIEPMPLPVPVPSRHEPPPASAELPPLHPATDIAASAREHGLDSAVSAPPRHELPVQEPAQHARVATEAAAAGKTEELAREGWVPLKHSAGAAVQDVQREAAGFDDGPAAGAGMALSSDPGAAGDNRQSFDLETPRGNAAEPASNVAGKKSHRAEGKLDTVLHKVEGKENFWDISRMYYNSGRYYKALWAANIDKVPQIDKLYRGTVIRIPPPEDLDSAYIEPAGSHSRRSAEDEVASRDAEPGEAEPSRTNIERTASRQAASGDGVPVRRSSRTDSDLNLPVSDVASDDSGSRGQSSRGVHRAVVDDAEPDYRPRDAVTRPIYKVRQYDTLRTIARDTLGDSRRANEILELNREIVDDPRNLIVGQILELPEDARPGRARSRR